MIFSNPLVTKIDVSYIIFERLVFFCFVFFFSLFLLYKLIIYLFSAASLLH